MSLRLIQFYLRPNVSIGLNLDLFYVLFSFSPTQFQSFKFIHGSELILIWIKSNHFQTKGFEGFKVWTSNNVTFTLLPFTELHCNFEELGMLTTNKVSSSKTQYSSVKACVNKMLPTWLKLRKIRSEYTQCILRRSWIVQ